MSNPVHAIFTGMGRLRPPTRSCCISFAGWFTNSLSNCQISSLSCRGPFGSWSSTQKSHIFFLVYGADTMVSIEVMVPSARLVFASNLWDSHNHICDVEALEERKQAAENKWLSYQIQISKPYNKRVKPWTVCIGDLVLKPVGHIKKCLSVSKFAPKCEGPYVICEAMIATIFLSLGRFWGSPGIY